MSAPTYWTPHKTRFTNLKLEAILGSGTNDQRANLALQLDADCEALLAIVYEMRGLQNACAPISALPAEVLIYIAFHVSESCPPIWHASGDRRDSRPDEVDETLLPGWTILTRVCRRWQAVLCGAPELWPRCDDAATETRIASFYTTAIGLRRIALPFFFPALRELKLSALYQLKLSETFDVLRQSPSLETLALVRCLWADVTISHSDSLTLSRLKSLSLLDLRSDTDTVDKWPFRCLLERLRYPRDTSLKLQPDFEGYYNMINMITFENSITLLCWLMVRVMRDIKLPDSPLWVGLDLSLSDELIQFVPTPAYAATAALRGGSHEEEFISWRTTINLSRLPLNHVFQHREILELMRDISTLSISMATVMQRYSGSPTDTVLFQAFCNVKILHTYLDPKCEDHVRPFLASVFRVVDNDLHLPRMREFWLGPIAPDGPYVDMLSHLVDALGPRVAHPGNALHTLRIAIPRPSLESEEGRYAAALESFLPRVVWGEAIAEEYGGDL